MQENSIWMNETSHNVPVANDANALLKFLDVASRLGSYTKVFPLHVFRNPKTLSQKSQDYTNNPKWLQCMAEKISDVIACACVQ